MYPPPQAAGFWEKRFLSKTALGGAGVPIQRFLNSDSGRAPIRWFARFP
jgi:hypothetical protein